MMPSRSIKGLSRLLTNNCFDRLQLSHNSEQDKGTTENNKRAKLKIIFMTTILLVMLYYCEKLLKNILDHTNMLSLQNKTRWLIMRFSGRKGQTGSLISSNHPHIMLVLLRHICFIFLIPHMPSVSWMFQKCSNHCWAWQTPKQLDYLKKHSAVTVTVMKWCGFVFYFHDLAFPLRNLHPILLCAYFWASSGELEECLLGNSDCK